MPEIKHTFTSGKMNKDLDERLVPNGQYRDAMNVQVRTTDAAEDGSEGGESGALQNLKGNKLVGHSYYNSWYAETSPTTFEKLSPRCVASVADEKNDKAYFFFATAMNPPRWEAAGTNVGRVYIDTIIEQGLNGQTRPIVVDIFGVVDKLIDVLPSNFENKFPTSGWSIIETVDAGRYRPGMEIRVVNSQGVEILDESPLKIKAIDEDKNTILLYEECKVDIVESGGVWFVFEAPRVLNFSPGSFLIDEPKKENYITGINVIDGMIFWTDNHSEPKKINIARCKAGTNINGINNNFERHTKVFIKNPSTNLLVDANTMDHNLDHGSSALSNGSGINSYLKEEHLTVMRPAPRTAPTLKMSDGVRPNTEFFVNGYTFKDINSEGVASVGTSYTIQANSILNTSYIKNDILHFLSYNEEGGYVRLIVKFISYQVEEDDEMVDTLTTTDTIKIKIITSATLTDANTNWNVYLAPKEKPLFETTFGRFAYRYKYADGEYSTFSPWSELAFLPGDYIYTTTDGYNLGMVNNIRELTIKDFIPYRKPLDVSAVEILYKPTNAANVYVVKTVEKGKSPEWTKFVPDGSPYTDHILTGSLQITSEMIHSTLQGDQLLRSWDNVPRFAKAQEIVGNRLVYGNYTQGYNINDVNCNIIQEIDSVSIENLKPEKSIKSIRDYKVGVVFGDKYGRETPVITSGYSISDTTEEGYTALTGDISVPKSMCANKNSFIVTQTWGDPNINDTPPTTGNDGWIDYVKYYVKETSAEYYNLVMDRWYPSGDDRSDGGYNNIWISFNSADRNKVDEDTYLILKNRNGTDDPILNEAKYKILAIENEAPEYIKTSRVGIGIIAELDGAMTGTTIWEDQASITNDSPVNLYTNTHMEISGAAWVNSGMGTIDDSSQNIFGRPIRGKLELRIIGAHSDSGTITGQLYSQWRTISHYSKGAEDRITLRWTKKFEQTDVDMQQRMTDIIAIGSDANFTNISNIQYWLEVRETVIENKPEFDGKFFVKIKQDQYTITGIENAIIPSGGAGTIMIEESNVMGYFNYISDKSVHPQADKVAQYGQNFATYVDFSDTDAKWYANVWDYFITPSIPDGEDDFFEVAGENLYGPNGEGYAVAHNNCNTIDCWECINTDDVFCRWELDVNNYFYAGSPYSISPFGVASPWYATFTRAFWIEYMLAYASAGSNFYYQQAPASANALAYQASSDIPYYSQCFLDDVQCHVLNVVPGPDRAALNCTDLPENGGPNTFYEQGLYMKPREIFSPGYGEVNGIVGATAGTMGNMVMSFVSNRTSLDADSQPILIQKLKSVGQIWAFADQPGVFYQTVGVTHQTKAGSTQEDGMTPAYEDTNLWSNSFDPTNSGYETAKEMVKSVSSTNFGGHAGFYGTYDPAQDDWDDISVGDLGDEYSPSEDIDTDFSESGYVSFGAYPAGGIRRQVTSMSSLSYSTGNKMARWRHTAWIEFRQIDSSGALTTIGLDLSAYDPRGMLRHDGFGYVAAGTGSPGRQIKFYNIGIENTDELGLPQLESEDVSTTNGAVFETEPKQSADLDIYYEASNALPMVLNENNAFDFAPIGSKVSGLSSVYGNENRIYRNQLRDNIRVNNIHFTNETTGHAIISLLSDDVSYVSTPDPDDASINIVTESDTFGQSFLHRRDFVIGSKMLFEHKDGTITRAVIKQLYKPVIPKDSDGDGVTDSFTSITSDDINLGIVSGPKAFTHAGTRTVEIYANAADNPISSNTSFTVMTSDLASQGGVLEVGDSIKSITGYKDTTGDLIGDTPLTISFGSTSSSVAPLGIQIKSFYDTNNANEKHVVLSDLGEYYTWDTIFQQFAPNSSNAYTLNVIWQKNFGYYGVDIDVWKQPVKLGWSNCYAFGNGLESDRIRDDYNAPMIDNGVKASTTFSGYRRETIGTGLIYSGLYNSKSQVNDLNQFNMSQKITKDLNPSYGSIQALKTRDTDVVVLAEDKILKVLANKDALYNADGNPQLVSSNRVLGTAIPFVGDYGISKDPQSLAWDQYRLYFTDRQRGAVLRLSRDGLTPISNIGMKTWFSDQLKKTISIFGSFDVVSGEYNVTLKEPQSVGGMKRTVSFDESSKGWVSFKSFIPDNAVSYSGKYVTAKDNLIYEHHASSTLSGNIIYRNSFYGEDPVNSSVQVIFNEQPSSVKSFRTMSYEGSQARVQLYTGSTEPTYTGVLWQETDGEMLPYGAATEDLAVTDNEYYNLFDRSGWWVPGMYTDLQQGEVREFKEKEGKWFNKISGVASNSGNLDTNEFTVQGVGIVDEVLYTGEGFNECISGCLDQDGNCVDCDDTDNNDECTNAAGDVVNCNSDDCVAGPCITGPIDILGCTNIAATNYNPAATLDDGSCAYSVSGCMDPDNPNYDPLATINDTTQCAENVVTDCMDPFAMNYNPEATQDGIYVEEIDPYTNETVTNFSPCYNYCSCLYDDNPSNDCNCVSVWCAECCQPNETWHPEIEQCLNDNWNDVCYDSYGELINCSNEDCVSGPCGCAGGDCGGTSIECAEGEVLNQSTEICEPVVLGCMDVNAINYMGPLYQYQWPNNSASGHPNINGVTYNGMNPNAWGAAVGVWDQNYAPANVPCFEFAMVGMPAQLTLVENTCCEYYTNVPIYGCTDIQACNYQLDATAGDPADYCSYDCQGCMDYSMSNFNPNATQPCYDSDGVANGTASGCDCCCPGCTGDECQGCTDPIAGNYNPIAIVDDGSCVYVNEDVCDCENEAPTANNPYPCYGCMDESATNYCPCCTTNALNPFNIFVNPCEYPYIPGCTDPSMFNYNPDATLDDGNCVPVITGCMDPTAANYAEPTGDVMVDVNTPCDDDCCEPTIFGCDDSTAYNFDPFVNFGCNNCCIPKVYGCMDPLATNYNPDANVDEVNIWIPHLWDGTYDGMQNAYSTLECSESNAAGQSCECEYPENVTTMTVVNSQDDSVAVIDSETNIWLLDPDTTNEQESELETGQEL